jgi:hypothetical protein
LLGVALVARFAHLAISVEGVTVGFAFTAFELAKGVVVAALAALAAAAVPALRASGSEVQRLLRSA